MTSTKEKTMLRKSSTSLIGAFAVLVFAVALAGCGGDSSSAPSTSAQSGEEVAVKTILVFNHEPASPSPSTMKLHAGLEKGHLPGGEVGGMVMTDEDCAPDEHGVSHCRNLVRLDSGQTVALRHPHNMTYVPCLEPGERVVLRRA
jgi:hypothetical protein